MNKVSASIQMFPLAPFLSHVLCYHGSIPVPELL